MGLIENRFEKNVLVTTVDSVLNWARTSSMWPLTFGLACCAIEMMATGSAHYDLDRFGIIFRATPRQADIIIIAGTVTKKMVPPLLKVYNQMPDPKWVVAMGSCATTGGPFRSYSVVQGIDNYLPVDVYVPGCPPRPQTLIAALLHLQDKIKAEHTIAKK